MELSKVMEWLLTEGFVTVHKGKPKFTSLFQKSYNGVEKGLTQIGTVIEPGLPALQIANRELIVATKANYSLYKYQDWNKLFMQFIEEAKVPRICRNAQGEAYATNKFNEDALKVFTRALKVLGADYLTLVRSTTLYYKSSTRYKKAVGNYFAHGDWQTDYIALANNETPEQLAQHIKTETKREYNPIRIG